MQGGNSDHPKTRKLRIKYKSYKIPAEIKPHRQHKYGALAATRDWDNNPTKRWSSSFRWRTYNFRRGYLWNVCC